MDGALVAELRGLPLFAACTDAQLSWIADRAEVRHVTAGALLYAEDEVPDAFWVLLGGKLRLTRRAGNEDVIVELTAHPGSWAGWVPYVGLHPIPSTARVVRAGRLLRLAAADLSVALDAGFPIANCLLSGHPVGIPAAEGGVPRQENQAALGRLVSGLAPGAAGSSDPPCLGD